MVSHAVDTSLIPSLELQNYATDKGDVFKVLLAWHLPLKIFLIDFIFGAVLGSQQN